MAHFAIIDNNRGEVIQVVRVNNSIMLRPDQLIPKTNPPQYTQIEDEELGIKYLTELFKEELPYINEDTGKNYTIDEVTFKQTSYNANGSNTKWYNYAGIGTGYDSVNGAFIAPKPVFAPLKSDLEKTLAEKRLNLPVYKQGEWQLDEKFRWTFAATIKVGLLMRTYNTIVSTVTNIFTPTKATKLISTDTVDINKPESKGLEPNKTAVKNRTLWQRIKDWFNKTFS